VNFRRGKPRLVSSDPRFNYQVGRLVGATEMMANYMHLHGDEKAQGMAARAFLSLEFFLDLSDRPAEYPLPTVRRVPSSEEVTEVIKPPGR
jgi:hypothetical protein